MEKKSKEKPSTYAKAGVDIKKEDKTISGIRTWVSKTFKFREGKIGSVMYDIGTFANTIDFGEYALAFTTDGVGSKVLVAQELEKYDTVGIDLVAMNVNDLLCLGAEPIAMVDYLAISHPDEKTAREISIGLYEGARQAEIAIVGGETATLPDIIMGKGRMGFDIAAAAIGAVKKDKIITGETIAVGDVILGFASSGIHSNGLTLARKVLPVNMWTKLLTPTRIYVKEVLTLLKEYEIHGLANITGSGMLNLRRITKHGIMLDKLPEPPLIFKKIQELGKVSVDEMYRTFNMGVGFCVICSEETANLIVGKYGREFRIAPVGRIVEGGGVSIVHKGSTIKLD
ncbi:MAG: phosphoribosylformylglycinamidine cyclo-ligase [Candidatus Altiarchaeota archaeon]